jgi:hypothetical protein
MAPPDLAPPDEFKWPDPRVREIDPPVPTFIEPDPENPRIWKLQPPRKIAEADDGAVDPNLPIIPHLEQMRALQPDRQNHLDSGASVGSGSPVRYLGRRVVGGAGSPSYFDSPPLVPSDQMLFSGQPALPTARFGSATQSEPKQAPTPLGLVSGEPMDLSFRPWIPGLPQTPVFDEDWLMRLLSLRRGR